MRIAKLELLAYGPFRGLSLDFSSPGIHVVFGRNEAGKSTTLRAITGLLYGIDAKTPDAHVHKFAELRIGGVLEDARGARVRVVRRKGNANTLLNDQEQPIDDSVIQKLLGGVSKDTFTHAFGLTHASLEAGAKALLEGKGDLGESLFDASVGGGGEVQRLVAELEAEAERIYKPRGSTLPLNVALKSFAEAQKTVRDKESRPEAFIQQEREIASEAARREARVKAKAELVSRRARLERARRRAPLERRQRRAMEELAALGSLAAHVDRVEALKERFSAYKHAVEQRRELVAEVARLSANVAESARRAGVDGASDGEPLRALARVEPRINALLRERAKLTSAVAAARAEIAKHERELVRVGALVGVSAPGRPLGEEDMAVTCAAAATQLVSAIERARNLGDIEARLATRRAQLERKRSDLAAKATADGLFTGTLDDFIALRVPVVASVERLERRVDQLCEAIARLGERRADLEREAASIERQIAGHTGDFAPPDAAALSVARAARDSAWRALLDSNTPRARAIEVEVERLLREADSVADRMIREADRVTTLARLRSEAETNARQLAKLDEQRAAAVSDRAALSGELAALFAEANIAPPHDAAFATMCAWLDRHAQIRDAYATLREADHEALDDAQQIDAARRALIRALSARGANVAREGYEALALSELIAVAARQLATIEETRRAAAEAARTAAKLRAEIDERLVVCERDEAALVEVSRELGELIAPLGVPASASADEVSRSIEALRDLFALADRRADAEVRARTFDAQIRELDGDLGRALAELAPDLASMEPRDAAPMLFARSVEARENALEATRVARELEAEGDVTLDEADQALVADPEALERALEELGEQIDEEDGEISRLTERIGGLRSGLEKMRAESNAAEAAAAAELQLSRVREHAERWSRVKLAAHLLSREIERYREENQGPMLTASSAFFSRLTLGSFSSVKAGFDDKDRPCLRCVRADGETEVDVAGLSDGTRDQLYLSLRLASLLRRVEVADPMPLVLDDVLIQLDDRRAAAALAVLAELSRTMQVLFFTHHARLVELARASVADGELVVHELVSGPYATEHGSPALIRANPG